MSVPNSFHISWANDLVGLTLASSIEAASALQLSNVQSKIPDLVAEFDMTGETTIAITDVGSPNVIRKAGCFAVHNHNIPVGATVRLRLYSAINQGGSVVFDESVTVPDPEQLKPHVSLWFDESEYKSFRIDITNAGGFTDDQLYIDKLWLGETFCPTYGPEQGWGSTLVDTSEHQQKPGGGVETIEGVIIRTQDLFFPVVEDTERTTLRRILTAATKGGDLLTSMDPNDSRGLKLETTSIFRRSSDVYFTGTVFNGSDLPLRMTEN